MSRRFRDHPQLLHHPQGVEVSPRFHYLAIGESLDGDARYLHPLARRGPKASVSPSWVPLPLKRITTVSPSATMSSMVFSRSGKASRKVAANCLAPSMPRTSPEVGSWLT